MARVVNVLIADDSATSRQMLSHLINNADNMRLIGTAINGQQAVTMACELHPDVVLMDLIMPGMSGLEATREIMDLAPVPIVVTSASLVQQETDAGFEAIKAGALTTIQKPVGLHTAGHEAQANELLRTIRAMADVAVIHHWKEVSSHETSFREPVHSTAAPQIVAVAASTGGPAALSYIIEHLPADFPLPIVIVQHIAPDFVVSLQRWLKSVTPLSTSVAQAGIQVRPGHIYLAPGNGHLRVNANQRFEIDRRQGTYQHMPSGDVLLESIARSYGPCAIGVVLTGMGNDGASGLQKMFDAGAFTIAQDEATSVVYGMPREAIKLGAAQQILPLQDIARILISLTVQRSLT